MQCGAPAARTAICSLEVEPWEGRPSGGSGSLWGAQFPSRRLNGAALVSPLGPTEVCAHECHYLRVSLGKDLDLEETPVDFIQSLRGNVTVWCLTGRECSLSDGVCQTLDVTVWCLTGRESSLSDGVCQSLDVTVWFLTGREC